ncbi:MAG: thioredoxin fold domain-containing protein [Pseudomonadales bacterium]|nr:thioredoxin fold domain-containing protein [Pseudomonadales bacterium]
MVSSLFKSFSQTIKLASAVLLISTVAHTAVADNAQEVSAFKKSFSAKLLKVNPQFHIATVEEAGMPGFYQVQIDNGPLLYATKNGDYFFTGTLYQLTANQMVNLTDQTAAKQRQALMAELNPAEMIIFKPTAPVKTKRVITVFTDVDCYYCQKLHKEVPELNARGIEVRYMAFPRAGLGSQSYKKIASAWCSKTPQETMTKLKNKEAVEIISCDNPVAKQYKLGKKMGVSGTPAILLEDGTLIPGYRPAADLAKQLGI